MSLIVDKDYITLTDKLESLPASRRQKYLQNLAVGLRVSFIGYCNNLGIPTHTTPVQFYGDHKDNGSPHHKKVEYYVGCFMAPQTATGNRWVCVHSSVWKTHRKRALRRPADYMESMDFKKVGNTLGLFGLTSAGLLASPHVVTADAIRKATANWHTLDVPPHSVRLYRYGILNAYGKAFATDDTLVLVVLPCDIDAQLTRDHVLALSRSDLELLMRYIE
mgnify:CR=1 FL=1